MMSKNTGSAIDLASWAMNAEPSSDQATLSGMILHDVAVHRNGDDTWASPPSRPILARDGTQIRGADGNQQYSPIRSFASRLRDRFGPAIVDALRGDSAGGVG